MSTFCTDSVDYQKFRPHGRVHVSIVDKQIALFHALGPFNLELLGALEQIESEVVVFEHSCLATEEVVSAFLTHLKAQKIAV